MSQPMFDQEEGGFTFTDDDFERHYYSPEAEVPSAPGSGNPSRPVDQQAKTGAAQPAGSRNRFMRTLLRRRFAASARTG